MSENAAYLFNELFEPGFEASLQSAIDKIMGRQSLEKMPDFFSDGVYDWIDKQLEKMALPGTMPRGAKSIGSGLELLLFKSLADAIAFFVESLSQNDSQSVVIRGVESVVRIWLEKNMPHILSSFEQLFDKGFRAGLISTGKMGTFDENALETIKQGRYRIGNRIKLFSQDMVNQFAEIIGNAYSPEGVFDLGYLAEQMKKIVPAQRYQLERIVRTETGQVSNLGRIAGWAQDDDRDMWDYQWLHANDDRVRQMKRIRQDGNPYSFSEIVFLFTHNEQNVPGIGWQMGAINCRCTIARSPRDEPWNGFRFRGREHLFRKTVDFDVSIIAPNLEM